MKLSIKILFAFLLLLNISCGQNKQYDFSGVDKLIFDGIADSVFPGSVLLVAKNNKVIYENAYGNFTYDRLSKKVNIKTIYDLASLTKIVSTTTAAMICIDRGLFNLNDLVVKYIPQFGNKGKENITIRNLLHHNSGLPAYKRFYNFCKNSDDVINDIYNTELIYKTGSKTVYSDLSMIVLQKIIEKVTGESLDEFSKENIFNPLEMNSTMFNPQDSIKQNISPTEFDDYWRHRQLQGEVHDETAALLNGVSGNAGLFSNVEDLSNFLSVILNKGMFKGKRIINEKTVLLFTSKQKNSERALGWDIKSPVKSSAGNLFSPKSYGHTGYTGTSFWVDPQKNLFVIFLTNRVYPTRNNTKIIKFRPKLHNEIIKTFYEN